MKTKYEPVFPAIFSANLRTTQPLWQVFAHHLLIETLMRAYVNATKKDYPVN